MNKFSAVMIVLHILLFMVIFEIMVSGSNYVKYDCNLVGISPDIPKQVVDACRARRAK